MDEFQRGFLATVSQFMFLEAPSCHFIFHVLFHLNYNLKSLQEVK